MESSLNDLKRSWVFNNLVPYGSHEQAETPDQDEPFLHHESQPPRDCKCRVHMFCWNHRRRGSFTILGLLIMLLAVWGFIDLSARVFFVVNELITKVHEPSPCWCGESAAEAIVRGCRWDTLAVDWLPQHCIDDELTQEFDIAGPGENGQWPYFFFDADDGFKPINSTLELREAAVAGVDYWATREWHAAHCLFTWRKGFRFGTSQDNRKTLEPWNNHEEHVEHCVTYILNALRDKRSYMFDTDTVVHTRSRHLDELK
ncbi:hypothetical protein BX600DRAFT_437876 [Xylariales sp. PMI_506]|nr:hypothetical protein BX600DRAFT_437876 [Xylariales sp. PMI_506]